MTWENKSLSKVKYVKIVLFCSLRMLCSWWIHHFMKCLRLWIISNIVIFSFPLLWKVALLQNWTQLKVYSFLQFKDFSVIYYHSTLLEMHEWVCCNSKIRMKCLKRFINLWFPKTRGYWFIITFSFNGQWVCFGDRSALREFIWSAAWWQERNWNFRFLNLATFTDLH